MRRVKSNAHKFKAGKIEIQLKGFNLPGAFNDARRMIAMVVMVHRSGYDHTVEALMRLNA